MKYIVFIIFLFMFSCNKISNKEINFSKIEVYIGGDLKIYNFNIDTLGNVYVVEKSKMDILFYKLKFTREELDSLLNKSEKIFRFKANSEHEMKHSYADGTSCKISVYSNKDTLRMSSIFGTENEASDSLCAFLLNLNKTKEKEYFFNEYSEYHRISLLVPPNTPIN